MQTINNEKFGKFLLQLRQEKGYTQKDIAEKIGVSDKAVSKWERGLSFPDITLLEPIATVYGITLTELYHGERILQDVKFKLEEVNYVLEKSIQVAKDDAIVITKKQKKRYILFFISIFLFMIQTIYLFERNYLSNIFEVDSFLTNEYLSIAGLCILFSIYFTFFVKEKLPIFYDQNKLNYYTNGIFRIHITGLNFNNSNWPHIIDVNCVGLGILIIIIPFIVYLYSAFSLFSFTVLKYGLIVLLILFILIPTYIVGHKYK